MSSGDKTHMAHILRKMVHWLTSNFIAHGCFKAWRRICPDVVIKRKVFNDLTLCCSLRDSMAYILMTKRAIECEKIVEVLSAAQGRVWDVGCNIGLFSLLMASKGCQVTAFDVSPRCCALLGMSARHNRMTNIRAVAQGLSVCPFNYYVPDTAQQGNKVTNRGGSIATALNYQDAAARYGIPSLIKMDIEGHEEVFLMDPEFKAWVLVNNITLVLEIHDPQFVNLLWADVPIREIEHWHYLINEQPRRYHRSHAHRGDPEATTYET